MAERPVVLVDMDGPVADFDGGALQIMRNRYPDIPILSTRTNFYLADDYPEHKDIVRAISDERGFFEDLPVVDDAVEGWQMMLDLGYDPRICGSPLTTNPTCVEQKIRWLDKILVPEFGQSVTEQAIFTKDKYLVPAKALIDDKGEIPHAERASWGHIVYDKEHNQSSRSPRLHGWLARDPSLATLLAEAKPLSRS